jgi:hypothetical protein
MALETLNTESTTQAPLAAGKTAAPRGNYALPTGGTLTGVDSGLLEKMQQIITEREAQKNSMYEALQEASAWGSGGMSGPSQQLLARQRQREEEDAVTFGMRNQISQYKAQQDLARRIQSGVTNAIGGGRAPGQAGGAPGQAGGAPGQAGGFNTQIDPLVAARVEALNQTDPIAARKYLDDHVKKVAEFTAQARLNKDSYAKVIEIRRPDGELELVSLIELLNDPAKGQPTQKGATAVQSMTGGTVPTSAIRQVESGGNPNAVSPKGAQGVMQVMPNTQRDPGFGVAPARDNSPEELERVGIDYYNAMRQKYGHDTLAAIAYNMGPGKTDEWLKAGANFNKLPAETQAYIGKVNLASALQGNQVATAPATAVRPTTPLAPPTAPDNFPVVAGEELQASQRFTPQAPVTAPAAITAPAPAPAQAPMAAPTAPAPAPVAAPRAPIAEKTIPQLRAEQAANAEFQKEAATGAGKNIAKQQEEFEANVSPTNVIEKRAANQRIIDLVMGSPNSVGLLEKPGMGAALATLAKNGLNTPSGAVGVQELEDALIKVMPGVDQKTINARNEIKQNLARGELEASKLAQGQGAVSDFERRLFAKVSGSTADTPELLIKRQQALVARENLNEKLGRLWGEQQTSGKAPNYAEFKNNPERRRLIAEYDKELNEILAKDINIPKTGAAKPAIPKYDAAKEARYQQWKQSQGTK